MSPKPVPRKRPTAKKTTATVTMQIDDVAYTLRPNEVNAVDEMALLRSTNLSVPGLLEMARDDDRRGIAVIAAFVWLARRQGGERDLTFNRVAEAITYDSDIDLLDEELAPDPLDDPAAP